MGRRKNKPRLIPEQDKRICGSICFCQLTMVLSCVSIVYLSVAVYSPSFKAFKSGFEPDPVMCQTVDLQMPNNCPWASCGEWCLTKTSGFCPQVHSVVRRNGTDIQLNNCTRNVTTHCPMTVDGANLERTTTMGRRKNRPPLIPEQDNRICRAICFCQLTLVLSCVSILYLSVAIYSPSIKAFRSGFEPDPVMCQTINLEMRNNCSWASCGEWCLTRTSGFCPQIHSVVRQNGTHIQLNNCTRNVTTTCPMIDLKDLKKFNCNNGTECNNLRGVFNCSNGHCKNMSELFLCHHKADGPTLNSEKDNTKLNGFFECQGITCTKIKKPFLCDRYCRNISTNGINVLLMQDNSLITADCETGVAFNEARGPNKGVRIPPADFWNEHDGILLANCMTVTKENDKIIATDCLNGTLLEEGVLPHPAMNFTQFWDIYDKSDNILDPNQKFLPKQDNLTIYSSKMLYINLEGCVNTLRGECKDFVQRYGSDGDNNTAQSRYQCYYNRDESVTFVVARFDLDKTYKELLIALILPIVLFVLSSISLCVITNTVKVGDDAKMRCVCSADDSDGDGTFGAGQRNNARYQVEDDCPGLGLSDMPEDHPADTHEMIGSTKSLIPLSPCEEIADNSFQDEKASKCDTPEKPLVVI